MEKLIIPKKINVGYQNRHGTYTGKLAYVIYWDNKGILRKETSWQSWRDKNIEPNDFDNEPTDGFVLNKGVGGQRESWGWNARNEYIRVYDPRGFEFEISVANMLYILQECTSTKGKGLEGKFIYAWDGKELVLLPVDTYEYKKSMGFTDLQTKKVSKNEMTPGFTYKFKDNTIAIYLGRLDYYENKSIEIDNPNYNKNNGPYYYNKDINKMIFQYNIKECTKKHIFKNVDDKDKPYYRIESGFTKIGECVTDIVIDNYAELIEEYQSTRFGGKCIKIEIEDVEIDFSKIDESYYKNTILGNYYILCNSLNEYNTFIKVTLQQDCNYNYDNITKTHIKTDIKGYIHPIYDTSYTKKYYIDDFNNPIKFKDEYLKKDYNNKITYYTQEDIENMYNYKKVYVVLENGTKIDYIKYF